MSSFELNITLNGVTYNVEVEKVSKQGGAVKAAPTPTVVAAPAPVAAAAPAAQPKAAPVAAAAGETNIAAPMPGKVSKVSVKVGDKVKQGQVLMLLEAMKMQNEIGSPVDGVVKAINVSTGDGVKPGQVMLVLA
ncbi:biotin/lipoyl-containing protein [Azotosporobacter soli]|uniref:biotin/lipoyl-containing protein n=1 Tax=Azotosporobacter soli TaxID=3055040 RepID=UPI0031FEA75F